MAVVAGVGGGGGIILIVWLLLNFKYVVLQDAD